ncbi:MAG: hypothetical protein JOZ32_09305 [Bryobacterales bacterium]|nr:hypothetical protein [Bryobacterales bacterium]
MKRKNRESGFALLLVFVLAAAIAIALFIEVPRIAFESQRTREQLAIDRGLQYQRAIQLYYRKYHLYPQTLDDLETTHNIRFLRHRYLDPLTGKDWRLLHVGPAGQLTDSLIQPLPPLGGNGNGTGLTTGNAPNSAQNPAQTSGFSLTSSLGQSSLGQNSNPAVGGSSPPPSPADPNSPNAQAPDTLNMAARRPSDRILAGANAGALPGAEQSPPSETDPNQPQPVQQPADPNQPVLPGQVPVAGQVPEIPGQAPAPVQVPGLPGQVPVAGQPQAPQYPGQPQYVNQPMLPYPGLPNTLPPGQAGTQPLNPAQIGPGGAVAAGTPVAQQNQAANLIQQILTTPRQPPASASPFSTGNTGGIAGVASTAEGKGIHVINDHSKYKEWEFVYDIKKDKTVVGAAGVAQQQQLQQQLQQIQTGANSPFGSPGATTNSPAANTANPAANSASPLSGAPTTPLPSQ